MSGRAMIGAAAARGQVVSKAEVEIREILSKVTPTPSIKNGLSDQEKIAKVTQLMTQVLETLGLDLKNDSLADTPKRIAKMYVNEIFTGLKEDTFPKITVIENQMEYDQMVLIRDIRAMSMCEHHFMPIHGRATVAYIPNKKVIGLSKINRIVNYFCRRPQVQERLTKQIADSLQMILETDHVAVHIDAKHYCVIARGVEDEGSSTVTTDLRGHFKSMQHTRAEFLAVTQKNKL
jgi:GTP cyclohydrolase I